MRTAAPSLFALERVPRALIASDWRVATRPNAPSSVRARSQINCCESDDTNPAILNVFVAAIVGGTMHSSQFAHIRWRMFGRFAFEIEDSQRCRHREPSSGVTCIGARGATCALRRLRASLEAEAVTWLARMTLGRSWIVGDFRNLTQRVMCGSFLLPSTGWKSMLSSV